MLREQGMEEEYKKLNQPLIALFRDNYEKNIATESEQSNLRIPRIIHQIWLGGEVPQKYFEWMRVWASLEGWDYKLWRDEDAAALCMRNRDLYDASLNKGEMADILRLEILNSFGGVYVDVDFECTKPEILEELHKQYDFYIGFEPLQHGIIKKKNMMKMCNAIIGSIPKHPLVKHLIENMKANLLAYKKSSGPLQTTGPGYITRIVCEYLEYHPDRYRNMYLPCTFFYPLAEKGVNDNRGLPEFAETAAIHYWDGSWKELEGAYGSEVSK